MISAVVLAKNEADNIVRCVRSLAWCNEVVVVDDNSTDATVELAEGAGARVVTNRFESFASQRNWAMSHANLSGEWILHLDADEVSTDRFASAIQAAVKSASNDAIAFALCRKTMLGSEWLKYSDEFPVYIMRLVRIGKAEFKSSGHGEIPIPVAMDPSNFIKEPFLHFAFSKGLADWITRHNRYSTREALLEVMADETIQWKHFFSGNQATRRRMLRSLSRRMPFRPTLRFIYQYLFRLGFLDGVAGLTFCQLKATYEWFIVLKRREIISDRKTSEGVQASRNAVERTGTIASELKHPCGDKSCAGETNA